MLALLLLGELFLRENKTDVRSRSERFWSYDLKRHINVIIIIIIML